MEKVRKSCMHEGLFAMAFLVFCSGRIAIATGPSGLSAEEIDAIPVVTIDSLDLDTIALEDEQRHAAGLPPRFAIPNEVAIKPGDHGIWRDGADGSRVWRLRIQSVGATSINLGFTGYLMPVGGRLDIFSTDQRSSIRPFTAQDNEDHGELWTPIVPSDDIIVQATIPKDEQDDLVLSLTSINIGYRGFGAESGAAGARSGSCNVDVICPEGDDWRLQIKCVAVIGTGGSTFCTGFMVNNTSEDLTPYFMTANHCGITSSNAASLVTYWNYENSWCRPPGSGASGGPGDGPLNEFNTGSFFRATYSTSDFTLVELDDPPDTAWDVGFCGWDANNVDATSAVGIHHPNTDEKRISFEFQPTTTTSYLGNPVPGDGTHVRIEDWDVGTTEPGSSGSPLFNQDHRVIGQLHGGYASCTSQTSDWYGKFARSWIGGGSNSTRLSNWLDPTGTGLMQVDFISEATLCRDAGAISLNSDLYACEGTALVKVIDCGLDADPGVIDTIAVTVSSDTEPGGETVTLTETRVDSAKFEGTVSFSETDSAGVVQVGAGDAVTASYTDADDGAGGSGIVVTAVASIDCTAPLISNVQTANVEPRSATVTFLADEPSIGTIRYGLACGTLGGSASSSTPAMSVSVDVPGLQDETTYFYAVDAADVAGNTTTDDNGGNCYTFTTPDIPNFFTEEFGSAFDLAGTSITFVPNGTVDFYGACSEPITTLPTDPSGGTTIALGDDDFASVAIGGGESVSFYGNTFTSFFVGSNGYVTFVVGDDDYDETLAEHFALQRISMLYDDLNPSAAGTVSWKQLSDRVAVTYQNVPEYNTTDSNTFQVEMFFEGGTVRVSYLSMDASDGIAGLSAGDGLSPDFLNTDLSTSGGCGPRTPMPAFAPYDVTKDRYISFVPNNTNQSVALQLELVSGPGTPGVVGWIQGPDRDKKALVGNEPFYHIWTEPIIHAFGCEVVPAASYAIRATMDEIVYSDPLAVDTTPAPLPKFFGDVVGGFDGSTWLPPNGTANIDDAVAVIQGFQELPSMAHPTRLDLHPEVPNRIININDVLMTILGFTGVPYPFSDPMNCP